MIAGLRAAGCTVSVVTRDYVELNLLMRSLRIPATVLGRHGGPAPLEKLRRFSERVGLLAEYLARRRPDAVVTLSNPESCRAAFGLKIPIVCFNDVPTSVFVARLTLPLASKVCAPWIIPKQEFARFGVAPTDLFFYRALDPLAWLQAYGHGRAAERPARRPLVVCRETEWQSSYLSSDIVETVGRALRQRHPEWDIISIPRYRTHRYHDVPALLADADLLVGGGGTMRIEAAYFGTPVIATRPLPSAYMQWLFARRLARRSLTVDDAVRAAEAIIARRDSRAAEVARRRARRIFAAMRFPLRRVVDAIRATAAGA